MANKKNITIIGAGYVGMSLATLLSKHNKVCLLDIDKEKVKNINLKKSPIKDKDIEDYLLNKKLDLFATTNSDEAFKFSDYIIIATPTSYDEVTNNFDTSSVEKMIAIALKSNKNALIVIKSTVPIGFTEKLIKKHKNSEIIFSPEFLREGNALYDNLNPSRIIVSNNSENSIEFAKLLSQSASKKDISIYEVSPCEAESIKLFANSYLAMRVSYFNELDNFALKNNLDSRNIIEGVCSDERIGNHYNNPSFGYGGYCLPKDTKQLLSNFTNVPQNLIGAIVNSNDTRKDFIIDHINSLGIKSIGVYRLIMKSSSDNYRFSAIQDVMNGLRDKGLNIVIYEPTLQEETFNNFSVEPNLSIFKDQSELIIANRIDNNILDVRGKIYSRDIFQNN